MAQSGSPAWRRRRYLQTALGRAGSAIPRARCWTFAICIGAALAGAAAAQSPQGLQQGSQQGPQPPCATTLTEEPISPIPLPPVADADKLELGERLFKDPRLSASGDLSCSSCHDVHSNGAGGRKASAVRDKSHGDAVSRFNTPTVFNATLSFRLNWEGNFRTLADQVEASLKNPDNLHTSVEDVVQRLNADPETAAQFRATYGRDADRENLLDALVTFEQSLVTPGSRFDRWLGGDRSALSDKEQDGYRLFKSLGCSSCHQGVNVGGNLMERQGIFRQLVPGKPAIVRVPSLRNVATTAPYFHDGSAPTLEDAIRRMAAAQLDRTLSDQQADALVAFLRTLTGTYRGAPVTEARQ